MCPKRDRARVSIHTLVKSVTQGVIIGTGDVGVSIHTLVKSVTCHLGRGPSSSACFNPHAREERDGRSTSSSPPAQRFNPHAREERDARARNIKPGFFKFQSTRS